jgi:hypothetical protein
MSTNDDKTETLIVDFEKDFEVSGLGKITSSKIESVFDEDDFLAYAIVAVSRN